jgi:hypothetical protein
MGHLPPRQNIGRAFGLAQDVSEHVKDEDPKSAQMMGDLKGSDFFIGG